MTKKNITPNKKRMHGHMLKAGGLNAFRRWR